MGGLAGVARAVGQQGEMHQRFVMSGVEIEGAVEAPPGFLVPTLRLADDPEEAEYVGGLLEFEELPAQ